ncbi:hypothetical protein BDV18DRAFT_129059 [Aspergillus unguis]
MLRVFEVEAVFHTVKPQQAAIQRPCESLPGRLVRLVIRASRTKRRLQSERDGVSA